MSNKVLVIGGAGYIGGLICRELLARGHQVVAFDALLFGRDGVDDIVNEPGFTLVEGDLRDLGAVAAHARDADCVILTAALVGEAACDVDPATTEVVNLLAPVAIAEACKYYGVERFVFASTDSVYGIQEGIISEDIDCHPVSLYARLKLLMEEELHALSTDCFKPVILRKATVYGLAPRMRFDLILNILASRAAAYGKISIFGGEQWRPMVHVADAARAYALAVEAPLADVGGEVFNVGASDQNYQIGKLGELVRQVVPDVEIETVPQAPDLRDYHVNCDKIERVLGFRVTRSCEEGIREVYEAVRDGQFADISDAKYRNA